MIQLLQKPKRVHERKQQRYHVRSNIGRHVFQASLSVPRSLSFKLPEKVTLLSFGNQAQLAYGHSCGQLAPHVKG